MWCRFAQLSPEHRRWSVIAFQHTLIQSRGHKNCSWQIEWNNLHLSVEFPWLLYEPQPLITLTWWSREECGADTTHLLFFFLLLVAKAYCASRLVANAYCTSRMVANAYCASHVSHGLTVGLLGIWWSYIRQLLMCTHMSRLSV